MGFGDKVAAGLAAGMGANQKAILVIRRGGHELVEAGVNEKTQEGYEVHRSFDYEYGEDPAKLLAVSRAALARGGRNGFHNDFKGTSDQAIRDLMETGDSGFMRMTVQYNPSTLTLHGNARSIATNFLATNYNNGVAPQAIYKPSITMSVQLVFDAMNPQDCFMMDKGGLSVGSAVSGVSDLVHQVKDGGYSVKDQTNAVVAALMSADTKCVTFCWNEMAFRGVATEAQASYVMFNTRGQPVRSNVTLKLTQQMDNTAQDAQNGFDLDALEKLLKFQEKSGRGQESLANNLLNLNSFT